MYSSACTTLIHPLALLLGRTVEEFLSPMDCEWRADTCHLHSHHGFGKVLECFARYLENPCLFLLSWEEGTAIGTPPSTRSAWCHLICTSCEALYFSSRDHTRIRLSLMKAHNNYYSTHLTISKINSRFQSTCHVQKGVWFDGVSHFRMGVKCRGQQWGPKMCNSIAGTHRKRSRSTRTAAGTRKNNSSQTTKLQTNYNEREPTT